MNLLLLALAGTSLPLPAMDGTRLLPGTACYALMAGDRKLGTTVQSITASREGDRPVWDIVVHQRLTGGAFDMRDHFVLDRTTLRPLRMDSRRGTDRNARGWHRVALVYDHDRITGTRETAAGISAINVPLEGPVWDGNLWGITFAALPLRAGGRYALPYWTYDKGFGTFIVRVIGKETVATPAGSKAAWIVEAGSDPARLMRYTIARRPRQEIGYAAGTNGQWLDLPTACPAD